FDSIGVEHDFSKLIQHFVENKVFADEGNHLYFRYRIFLGFFIAHRMQQSPDFLLWLLTDFRFANFISEFDIYFGLSRGDLSTLEFFGREFGRLSGDLEKELEPLGSTDRFEKLSIPALKEADADQFTAQIERQLTGNTSAEARDEALSGEMQAIEDVKPDRAR